MENISNSNHTGMSSFNPNIWRLDTVIIGMLVVISFYLLVALIFHQLKMGQHPKKRFANLSIEKKYGVLSKYTCILIGVASFLRHVFSFAELWIELYIVNYNLSSSQEAQIANACRALPSLFNVALSFGSGLVFFFLWFRQRLIYVHPSLKILSNKCLKTFSFGIIVGWLLFYIALFPIYFTLIHFHYVPKTGCVVKAESIDSNTNLAIAWISISIFMQLSLLLLFIYPILKRAAWKSHQRHKQSSKALLKRVKKAAILSSVSFCTDIATILVNRILSTLTASNPTFDFGTNLVINHLVTIACFDDWKQLLWPWTLDSKMRSQSCATDATKSFTDNAVNES